MLSSMLRSSRFNPGELTNNPHKIKDLASHGIEVVAREPIAMAPTADNLRYLMTKQQKLGHLLNLGDPHHHGND